MNFDIALAYFLIIGLPCFVAFILGFWTFPMISLFRKKLDPPLYHFFLLSSVVISLNLGSFLGLLAVVQINRHVFDMRLLVQVLPRDIFVPYATLPEISLEFIQIWRCVLVFKFLTLIGLYIKYFRKRKV